MPILLMELTPNHCKYFPGGRFTDAISQSVKNSLYYAKLADVKLNGQSASKHYARTSPIRKWNDTDR